MDGKGDTYTKDALGKVKISENATYVAKYEEVPAGHKLVIFAVDGKVVDIQKVVSGKKPRVAPHDPPKTSQRSTPRCSRSASMSATSIPFWK